MNQPKQGISWATLLAGVIIGAAGMFMLIGVVDRIRDDGSGPFNMTNEQRAAAQTNVNRIKSQTHMRGIVQGLIMYAQNHDEQFPPRDHWPQALIDADYINPEVLTPPLGGEYTLVTMPRDLDPSLLVLYENPEHFETGVNAVFADTSIQHLPHDEFHRLLAQQSAESP